MGRNSAGELAIALVRGARQEVIFGRKRKDGTRSVKAGRETAEEVIYWLVPSADIPRDATALPRPEKIDKAIARAAADFIDRESRRAA
jgi:hypothetical protein